MSKEPVGTVALMGPEIAAAVQKTVEENSDKIGFDPEKAKEGFEKITKVLGADNKIDEAELVEIRKIGNESEDSGLKVFAKAVANVLELGEAVLSDKSSILNSLKENFGFLGEEKDPKPSEVEISALILGAVKKTTLSHKENEGVVNAINSGFKEAFSDLSEEVTEEIEAEKNNILSPLNEEEGKLSPEKRREIEDQNKDFWNSAMEIMPDAAKAATALTLALAVPPPIGIILALGFLAYTWNMGHEPGEKKPDIYNDPEVQSYADAWKGFVKPEQRQELTEKDRKNAAQDPTNVGEAASVLIEEAGRDLNQGKKVLKQNEDALKGSSASMVSGAGSSENVGGEVDSKQTSKSPRALVTEADHLLTGLASLRSATNVSGSNRASPNAPEVKLGRSLERGGP